MVLHLYTTQRVNNDTVKTRRNGQVQSMEENYRPFGSADLDVWAESIVRLYCTIITDWYGRDFLTSDHPSGSADFFGPSLTDVPQVYQKPICDERGKYKIFIIHLESKLCGADPAPG